jgi:hypothetical protein
MSSELSSCTGRRIDTSSTRISYATSNTICYYNLSEASDTTTQRTNIKNPLEAAMVVKTSYIETLHESLFKFLDDLSGKCIQLYSEFFYKNVKYQANSSDPAYLPKPIKHIGLVTLQSCEEVRDCKDFKTLLTKLLTDLDATRRRITKEYLLPADNLLCLALKRRFQHSICRLLTSAALGFIAEIDIKNYTEHEAVMDLLASSPHLMLVNPISKDHREFLLLYKEAHTLKFVPRPTIEHKAIASVFNEINDQATRFPQTLVDLTIEKTTRRHRRATP